MEDDETSRRALDTPSHGSDALDREDIDRIIEEQRDRGERPFRVVRTRVRVRVDPARPSHAMRARAVLTLEPCHHDSAPIVALERLRQEGVALHLRPRLRVKSVEVPAGCVAAWSTSNFLESPAPRHTARDGLERWLRHYQAACRDSAVGELLVASPPTLGSEQFDVCVEYEAEQASSVLRYAEGRDMCWTENAEADSAPLWLACVDDPVEACLWEVEIVVPSRFHVVASGDLLAKEPLPDDPKWTSFRYALAEPVAARSVGFVAGDIEAAKDVNGDPRLFAACPSGRLEHAQHCFDESGAPRKALKFCEAAVGVLPWPWLCLCFVPDPGSFPIAGSFAGLAVLSEALLHGPDVVDAHDELSEAVALAIARQWFGALVGPRRYEQDLWLVLGLGSWMQREFLTRFLGYNHVRYRLAEDCEEAARSLPWRAPVSVPSGVQSPYVCPSEMTDASSFALHSAMVVHMLARRVGAVAFSEVIKSIVGERLPLSTDVVLERAAPRCSEDLRAFAERWIAGRGFPPMAAGFWYNRKKRHIEFTLRIDPDPYAAAAAAPDKAGADASASASASQQQQQGGSQAGAKEGTIAGKFIMRQWESDGTHVQPQCVPYDNEVTFDSDYNLMEFRCYTRTRKARKRRNQPPAVTAAAAPAPSADAGAESPGEGGSPAPPGSRPSPAVPVAVSQAPILAVGAGGNYKTGIPVFWLRVDPEMDFVHQIAMRKPELMWINQLERDRDVAAQREAVQGIVARGGSALCVQVLEGIVRSETTYWKVRIDAARGLAQLPFEIGAPNSVIKFANQLAYSSSPFADDQSAAAKMNKQSLPNQITDLPSYYVRRNFPEALAMTRGPGGLCTPREAIELLRYMIKNNDNTDNQFTDAYLQAARARALGVAAYGPDSVDLARKAAKQLRRLLDADKIVPSHRNVITRACLWSLASIHETCPQPELLPLLWTHASQREHGAEIRMAALEAICSVDALGELPRLLGVIEDESELPYVRRGLARALARVPRARLGALLDAYGSAAGSDAAMRLWTAINGPISAYDSVLRCLLVDLYQRIWGLGRPKPFTRAEDAPPEYATGPAGAPPAKRARGGAAVAMSPAEPRMMVSIGKKSATAPSPAQQTPSTPGQKQFVAFISKATPGGR
eukprot:m51a1_g1160 hypothetical protein (1138) ;mRNA; r:326056-329729